MPTQSLSIEQLYQVEKHKRSQKVFEIQQRAEKARLLRSKQRQVEDKNINMTDTETRLIQS